MGTAYRELVIEGRRGRILGFLEGFLAARGGLGRLVDLEAEGFRVEPLGEQIREMLHPRLRVVHALVPEDLVPLVREAVAAGAARGYRAEIHADRPVRGARFRFSVRAYQPADGERLRTLLGTLPAGSRLVEGPDFRERVDPSARDVELYAPAHHYELRGEGVVEGTVEAVLELYRACRREELVRLAPAELVPVGERPGSSA